MIEYICPFISMVLSVGTFFYFPVITGVVSEYFISVLIDLILWPKKPEVIYKQIAF